MQIQNIYELFALDDRDFVASAYRNLLGREADEQGLAYYLGRLAMGYGKESIIVQLAHSRECRHHDEIKGLKQFLAGEQKTYHWFWGIFRRSNHLEKALQSSNNAIRQIGRSLESLQHVMEAQTQNLSVFAGHGEQLTALVARQPENINELISMPVQTENGNSYKLYTNEISNSMHHSEDLYDPPALGKAYQLSDILRVDYRAWKTRDSLPSTDIIICVHNALIDVKRCLSSVIRYTLPPACIIIVDDGSEQSTAIFLRGFCSDQGCILIRNEVAKGYTFAANQGLLASKAQYCVLLNSDTIVSLGWLDKLIACASSSPLIGLVGPLSNTASWQSVPEIVQGGDWATNDLPDGIDVKKMSGLIAKYSSHLYPRLSFLNGFCLLVKRAVVDDIGYFDEETFGRGYGEENDYCIRARENGWQLALADQAYVFHAQSKSYSHDKRKILSQHAGEKLTEKHGLDVIEKGVHQCQYDRCMLSIRAHVRKIFEREELVSKAKSQWEGHSILFILPIMHAGGGGNVVITEARALQRMGIRVAIVNLVEYRECFERSYPDLGIPINYISGQSELEQFLGVYDAFVATANNTAHWLKPFENNKTVRLGYYIQDYEPYFYEVGSAAYEVAKNSYMSCKNLLLFTKTKWNKREVLLNTGLAPRIVGPSYDTDLFRARFQDDLDSPKRPLRITAMVRPSSPRRNPLGTIEVLISLSNRYGPSIRFSVFGNEPDGPPLPHSHEMRHFEHYGQLRQTQIVGLLSKTDVFLDMSNYQAMGLTALEAMSCGAVPIVPQSGGATSFARHGHNSMIIDSSQAKEAFNCVAQLIDSPSELARIRENAIHDAVEFHPEAAAYKILEILFG